MYINFKKKHLGNCIISLVCIYADLFEQRKVQKNKRTFNNQNCQGLLTILYTGRKDTNQNKFIFIFEFQRKEICDVRV